MTFADRHALLARGYGGTDDPENPADVLAMPLVVHVPKIDPPPRSQLLEAAAIATISLCLDDRIDIGGPWHDDYVAWTGARIRKVARRARGAQWTAVGDVDGVTAVVGDASARAFVPGRVGDLDPRVKRLQIGGTDLPHDEPGAPDSSLPVLWIQGSLDMTLGKAAAQVGHSVMLLGGALSLEAVTQWAEKGYACSVRLADDAQWRALEADVTTGSAVAVRDAGFTEVAPGSMTVIATSRWLENQGLENQGLENQGSDSRTRARSARRPRWWSRARRDR